MVRRLSCMASVVLESPRWLVNWPNWRQMTRFDARLKQAPFEPLDFVPVYIACDDSIKDIETLMLRLLSDEDALAPWVPFKVIEKEVVW